MSSAMIMEVILTKIKTVLSEAEEVLATAVTPEYKRIEQPHSPGNTT